MYSGTGEAGQRFSLAEILSATNNFDEDLVIGCGGFGKVYKGQLSTDEIGHLVAIKRLSAMSTQGEQEFIAEIETLSNLRHSHLVSLIGYCDDNKEMILVYQYMPNGTLYHHLHKSQTILNWVQRIKIAIGAGRGLDYLHTGVGTTHGIIHRDVKSSNVLLDVNMEAKISDFGLSKIGPTNQSISWVNASIKGTFGYLDPEYFYTRKLSRKTDVYAFGVVLFELLTGRRAVDERNVEEECNLVRWAKKYIKQRKLDHMVDTNIRGTIFRKCLTRFAQIAKRCVHDKPKERPTMSEVVGSLQVILELQLKYDNYAKPSGIMGFSGILGFSGMTFSWKTFYPSLIKQNSSGLTSGSITKGAISKVSSGSRTQTLQREGEILQSSNLKSFTFSELKIATRNFRPDSVLGEGGFGSVFKGWVDEHSLGPSRPGVGIVIAVKRLNQEGLQGHNEWLAEINYLGQLRHPNLVKLLGYCLEDDHRLLAYEFMENGSMENHLFRSRSYFQPLSWCLRMKVALGAARGLAFLHNAKTKVIHRDFKTSNILLDSSFNAKLSDFGIAKDGPTGDNSHVSTRVMGTLGYAAPEYMATGHLTAKSDIYSFGVVLLEILSGQRALDRNRPSGEQNLVEWATPYLTNKRRIFRVLDPRLEGQYSLGRALKVANLAIQCLYVEPKMRPSMDEVVATLEQLQDEEKTQGAHNQNIT